MSDTFQRLRKMVKEATGQTMEETSKPWLTSIGLVLSHISKCDKCMENYMLILEHTHESEDNQKLTDYVLDKIDEIRNGDLK